MGIVDKIKEIGAASVVYCMLREGPLRGLTGGRIDGVGTRDRG